MTVPQKIYKFLKLKVGIAYCDDCLARLCDLKRRQESAVVTATLSLFEKEFERKKGICGKCPCNTKLVTRAI